MNRICNWIVDHKHYSHLPKQCMKCLIGHFTQLQNSQIPLLNYNYNYNNFPFSLPYTFKFSKMKSTATPFLDALDVGEWVKQSVTNSFFRDFSFKIRMNYVSSYLRSCLSKFFISKNVFPINYGGIHIFIIWILLHVGHFLMCRLYWNSSKVKLSFTPFFLLAFIQLI